MKDFFENDVLIDGATSKVLYGEVKNLPIIDYHCHLDQKQIAQDTSYENLGQLWLAADHYKWRAMRLCGVAEKYITGEASWKDKFLKYAEVMPKLIGNPLYYWSHLELKQVFGINTPLNSSSAEEIYSKANEKLTRLSTRKLLKSYKVEFIATTDNPSDELLEHGKYDNTLVAPTFRPDKVLAFDAEAITKLSISAQIKITSLADIKSALANRLDFFVSKGCRIADHGFLNFPTNYASDNDAQAVYERIETATAVELDGLVGNLLVTLMREYKQRDIVLQLHFSVLRSVNNLMKEKIGMDTGFDVIANECNLRDVILLLNQLTDEERPSIMLYSLNENAVAGLSVISGAFRNVYMGAAWWFNDTLEGIKRNLSRISEYACLGTNLGMLTDSRSFMSYSRFDFFRRILCSFVGAKVDNGEYCLADAITLVQDICYNNIKKLLNYNLV